MKPPETEGAISIRIRSGGPHVAGAALTAPIGGAASTATGGGIRPGASCTPDISCTNDADPLSAAGFWRRVGGATTAAFASVAGRRASGDFTPAPTHVARSAWGARYHLST